MAGRPCRGTKKRTNAGFAVEVPTARGSKLRMRRSFDDESHADDWRAAALVAIDLSVPIPEPGDLLVANKIAAARVAAAQAAAAQAAAAPAQVAAPNPAGGTAADAGVSQGTLVKVAAAYVHEIYEQLNRGDVARMEAVEEIIKNHIFPFMDSNGFITGSGVTRISYLEFLLSLSKATPTTLATVANSARHTIDEAVAVTKASRSTIKRRLDGGAFPGAAKDAQGRWRIPHRDLIAAGLAEGHLRTGPRHGGGYSEHQIGDIKRTLDAILLYGEDRAGWKLKFRPERVKLPKRDEVKPVRLQVTLADVERIAEHLHAVHQLVLWLVRVLGLRISEAYGIEVGDIIAERDRGLLRVYRQGGRNFEVRDPAGGKASVTSKEQLKNARSRRVLIIPSQLMSMIDVVIQTFHTDPVTGYVDPKARLIPGL